MATARLLKTQSLNRAHTLAHLVPGEVKLDAPAMVVLRDYHVYPPVSIEPEATIPEIETLMRRSHEPHVLVTARDGKLLGTINHADLTGERFAHRFGRGVPRPEISAREVMTSFDALRTLTMDALANARVRDIAETLRAEHVDQLVITEDIAAVQRTGDAAHTEIRGMIYASDVARVTGIPLAISRTPSLADVCHTVAQHVPEHRSSHLQVVPSC